MKESKVMKFSEAIYRRLKKLSPRKREEVIGAALDAREARALSAPAESLVEAPVAGVETKMKMALPELQANLSPGSATEPGEGLALLRLPEDCRWFVSLDDASRADAVRRSLARCRDVAADREELLASLSNPEGLERPEGIPKCWEPATIWIPPKDTVWMGTVQAYVEQALCADRAAALRAEAAEEKEKLRRWREGKA